MIHEADRAVVRSAKAASDVAGHYSRPDVFTLLVRGISATQMNLVPTVVEDV